MKPRREGGESRNEMGMKMTNKHEELNDINNERLNISAIWPRGTLGNLLAAGISSLSRA